jgi:hypothetical protein
MILMFEFPMRRTYELLLGQLHQARTANVNMKVSISYRPGFYPVPFPNPSLRHSMFERGSLNVVVCLPGRRILRFTIRVQQDQGFCGDGWATSSQAS